MRVNKQSLSQLASVTASSFLLSIRNLETIFYSSIVKTYPRRGVKDLFVTSPENPTLLVNVVDIHLTLMKGFLSLS